MWGRVAALIAIAYLIFTTAKGNLRTWLEIIGLKASREAPTGPAAPELRGRF